MTFSVGTQPVSIAVGDFNRDGKPDLAVVNSHDNTVSILLGNGDGTFRLLAPDLSTNGSNPSSIVAGDFNGDGLLDLAVANALSSSIAVFPGDGDGTFQPATTHAAGGQTPVSIVAADFNGDGRLDLAVANLHSNNVAVLLGDGHGAFHAPENFGVGDFPYWLAAAAFNLDSRLDLATANKSSTDISVLIAHRRGGRALPGAGLQPRSSDSS